MAKSSLKFDPSEIEEFNKQYDQEQKSLAPVVPSDTGGMSENIEDVLKGVGQGATLGFGDELLAAAEAIGSTAFGKNKLEDLLDTYRKYQKENEASFKESQERSPMLTLGGELVGGFFMPGGLAVKGAKALGATSKLGQAVLSGAAIGGLSNIGTQEGGSDLGELATAGIKGAAVGGALGGATDLIGKAVGKAGKTIGKYVEESPELSKLPRARKLEKSLSDLDTVGTALGSKEGQDRIVARVQQGVDNLADSIDANRKFYGGEIKKIHEKAKNIVPINDKTYNRIIKEVQDDPELRNLLRSFNPKYTKTLFNETADVRDLIELRKSILSNIKQKKSLQKITDDEVERLIGTYVTDETGSEKLVGGLVDDLNSIIEKRLPELAKARTEYTKAAEIPEMILNKSTDPLDHAIKLYDRSEEEIRSALKKQLGQIIGQSGGRNYKSAEQRQFLKAFQEAMKTREGERVLKTGIEKSTPRPVLSAKEFYDKASNLGADVGVLKTLLGEKSLTDETLQAAANVLTRGGIMGMGATEIGAMAGKAEKMFSPAVKGLKKYSVDQLRGYAELLRKNPATEQFGENALRSLDNPTSASRSAFINQVMQNPKMRETLGLTVDRKEEENE